MTRRLGGIVAAAVVLLAASAPSSPGSSQQNVSKVRGDLAALVSGGVALDARIPPLVSGYQQGEIPFFAVLSAPNDASHRAAIEALGARVLRTYKAVDAFALAAQPASVLAVGALPWVAWLAPVEVVTALDHEDEVDQTRGTPIDVGATVLWNESPSVLGAGVKIAVLDTGLTPHLDLDDLDFRHWSNLVNPPKVLHSRNFIGAACAPAGTEDGHGHGTHVAGIATGTGEGIEGDPADDGKYAGVAPGASLVVGKVVTDAGVGINSDLVAAMEAVALPEDPLNCQFGVDIVNISLGNEARPTRLNTDSDVDAVAFWLNRLAVTYGTLFVAAAGNSGPFIGSLLEAPGAAAQALSVSASAKDWDVNHDDTASGDACAGWLHPGAQNDCSLGIGTQPTSLSNFTSRGPSGDLFLRPDLAAPGYNIVSAQSATGAAFDANDLSLNTRDDPLYATATGTSMAAPSATGSAALVLDAYRQAHGEDPSGPSGISGLKAPKYVLLRAALMNTAAADLYDARWILTTEFGSLTLYEVRNRDADPYVGTLSEGAGKLDIDRAATALRDGIVIYGAANPNQAEPGTGHRDFQGSWQIGPVDAGSTHVQRFVLHAAPGIGSKTVSFSFEAGNPSDGSSTIPLAPQPKAWKLKLPGSTTVSKNKVVSFSVKVPSNAAPGLYSGTVVAQVTGGQTLRLPVFAAVALHDRKLGEGEVSPSGRIVSGTDVFAKDNTTWPSIVGTPGTGSNADWLVYPIRLASALSKAVLSVYDAAAGDETYDVYLFNETFDLAGSTHPFAAPGITDQEANDARGPSTEEDPEVLTMTAPAGGRYYVAVSRAKIGGATPGDFGAFVLTLNEVG